MIRYYTRVIFYRRVATDDGRDIVEPWRWTVIPGPPGGNGTIEAVCWSSIRPAPADLEYQRAWAEHVAAETAAGRNPRGNVRA